MKRRCDGECREANRRLRAEQRRWRRFKPSAPSTQRHGGAGGRREACACAARKLKKKKGLGFLSPKSIDDDTQRQGGPKEKATVLPRNIHKQVARVGGGRFFVVDDLVQYIPQCAVLTKEVAKWRSQRVWFTWSCYLIDQFIFANLSINDDFLPIGSVGQDTPCLKSITNLDEDGSIRLINFQRK